MIEYLFSIFQDHTLKTVLLGSGILGLTSGILGSFALLRKQSLLGDAISHSALPGIAIAFLKVPPQLCFIRCFNWADFLHMHDVHRSVY